jgi:dTDP-4-dehydrorhamnose 3,5-epimerase
MKLTPDPDLAGLHLLEPRVFQDERGFFLEAWRQSWLDDAGLEGRFVQANHSLSTRGAVRGLHYQAGPGQPKLVRCTRGTIWDVAVDIRPGSPTLGRWKAYELSSGNFRMVYIPRGFAHGFAVLSEEAEVQYLCGTYYDGALERGIAWDDPGLAVAWPVEQPVLSDRDRGNPSWRDVLAGLPAGPA